VSLNRAFANGLTVMASYTWSRVHDVQTPLRVNFRGFTNWSSRAVSGSHEFGEAERSLNDVPHRMTLAGTWRAPWSKWITEISFVYIGESGSPFTWVARGSGGRGDLNADGSTSNDPIYVPVSALDPDEIMFTGLSTAPGADNSPAAQAARVAEQRQAFERFIEEMPCRDAQRGSIMRRNSCHEPWSSTTALSLRQSLPVANRAIEAQLDVLNVLNLLNDSWGLRRVVPGTQPLTHTDQEPGPTGQPEPVFRFDESATGWQVARAESNFQLQFGLRYRF
jgi:hypothetical protein